MNREKAGSLHPTLLTGPAWAYLGLYNWAASFWAYDDPSIINGLQTRLDLTYYFMVQILNKKICKYNNQIQRISMHRNILKKLQINQ